MSSNSDGSQRLLSLVSSLLQTEISKEILSYKEFIEFMTSERITFLKICYLPNSNKIILMTNYSPLKIKLENEETIEFYYAYNKIRRDLYKL